MKTAATSGTIDRYISTFPHDVQTVLKRVRAAIRGALPDADESISYRIPTYRIGGRPVIYFAAFKAHYSVYPFTRTLVEAFEREAARYEVNNKGTIRFSYADPVPARFIARIAKFRAKEVAAHSKGRTRRAQSKSRSSRSTA